MKKKVTKRFLISLGLSAVFVLVGLLVFTDFNSSVWGTPDQEIAEKELTQVEKKAARSEYFFKLLRDPKTNRIPDNIRNRELNFAKQLPTAQQVLRKTKGETPSMQAIEYNWNQAGPLDVGGRTRALAVDQEDPNTVLAGGVSGGMWKSVDGGQSWQLKTPDLPNLSVTSVTQDPLNPTTWYYASGEVLGNSASASNSAPYYGQGIYKSTDNGESWSLIQTSSGSQPGFVDPFNTVSRIRVSPTTGSVFLSSIGYGIYRSTDGQTFSNVLGGAGEQLFADVAIASDGTIAAVISEADFDDQTSQDPSHAHDPGIFISEDDGDTWTKVTPGTFPDTHRRSVLSFAPNNPDYLYVFTLKGANDTDEQGVSFHLLNLDTGDAEDRSANLPDFRSDGNGTGYVNPQGGYNMTVAVKPDDDDYVFVGTTNLFRSSDGFATAPNGGFDGSDISQKNEYWIGGYNKDNSAATYPSQHPDQHILAFPQPQINPDMMWSGHDGGLSFTDDVTAESVTWEDRDDGYITSQFYAVDIPSEADDNRLMGGTQDNGTPFFNLNSQRVQQDASVDRSSGDGAYNAFGENYLFVSSQLGRVIRWNNNFTDFSYVSPLNASNQLFIHPFVVDPNDEDIMYYPESNYIWRNTTMTQISNNNSSGTSSGWEELQDISVDAGYTITALEVSQIPQNILYFAGSSDSQSPDIRRLDNAKTATDGAVDISDFPTEDPTELDGAYVKDIAINPVNANEAIVVLSNYNITGLFHTTDGGENWSAIEGNLKGDSQTPGPSLRSAAMIPAESGTIYFVGSSTGLYSTQTLDGENTTWGQEASAQIGNAVTEDLAARISNGDVAAGTHGRGIFFGSFQGNVNAPFITANPSEGMSGASITLIANDFQFNANSAENIVTFGDVQGTVVSGSQSELTVEVPRGVVERDAPDRSVIVKVDTGSETIFTNFTVLPPNDFAISPNYPNPFNPSTTIPFDIPSDSRVTLAVYNINGQKVLEPIRQTEYNAGTYNETVDFSNLASGVYIYRIIAETDGGQAYMESRKMTLIK